jgi:hypothetical protein
MDAEKLIEEAGRWAESIRRSPGKGTAGEDLYGAKLLTDLATALRAECKRVEVLSRDVSRISGEREHWQAAEERARQDRDEYAAANLAANKRIVELEQETDGLHDALRTCDESRKELIDGLKTARDTLDLGKRLIQALQHERDAARAELARLTTPRPIEEAPKDSRTQIVALWMDGNEIESMDVVIWADMDDGEHPERKFWMNMAGDSVEHMTHFLPLPVLP